jgi:hypothetical protein
VSGLGLTSLILKDIAVHSKNVFVNFYTNGTMDFSMDITYLAKSALMLAFGVFVVGLLLGLLMVKVRMPSGLPFPASDVPAAIGVLEIASNIANFRATTSDIAANDQLEKYARVLSKSGLIRGVVTEGRLGYELTDAGVRFLKEYKEIVRDLKQEPSMPVK